MNIPRVTPFPPNAGQCDDCGGHGCMTCGDKGWLAPMTPEALAHRLMDGSWSDHIRRCERDGCGKVIPPSQVAVYCTNECALEDA